MKLKSILLTAVATISLATATMAQVPNYVPSNGLVGWWPFNSNANDESGNGNNGTVNGGTTLSTDRFGNSNNAYYFDGVNDYISNILSMNSTDSLTISLWYLSPIPTNISSTHFELWESNNLSNQIHLNFSFNPIPTGYMYTFIPGIGQANDSMGTRTYNAWHHIVVVKAGITETVYVDNIPNFGQFTGTNSTLNFDKFELGREFTTGGNLTDTYYIGKLDDIGIWNRALTQQEITDLYNAVNCSNNTSVSPQTNSLTLGSTATFTASTSDPNPSYAWQSDLGQGFQILNNFGNYTGTNTGTLNIANVQLPNHTQSIRVITTSGNCIDTSNVAVINILDTCITNVTVYDTLLTTVTDTLVINAQITGINPPNNLNILKVFPNPASTHITIDYGNFNAMSGYTLTIVNSTGQTVFTTPINQQTSYIDLSTWAGTGIYFVQLIDPQNNTIENRKILIQ